MTISKIAPTSASWRDRYPPHPCADVFPMMSEPELEALAKDIREHGLQDPIVFWRGLGGDGTRQVLDGRNRLAALERLGRSPDPIVTISHDHDPATYVISANIRRRHLTKEQQAELIVKTIEAGKNDLAKVARSFNPTTGKKGGSTKDPVVARIEDEGKKHGISTRTMRNARAKLQGKTPAPRTAPKSSMKPTPPLADKLVDKLAHAILATVGDGDWHRLAAIVECVKAPEADVVAVLTQMRTHGAYHVFCQRRKSGTAWRYRIVRGCGRMVDAQVLITELHPLIEALHAEARKHLAKASLPAVAKLTHDIECVLERLLSAAG